MALTAVTAEDTPQPDTAARSSVLRGLWRAMRPYQWAKNFLVFAPPLFGHRLREPEMLVQSSLAFGLFCLMASGIYILNDLADIELDRLHPHKRHRPLAAGDFPIAVGVAASAGLLLGALLLAVWLLPKWFAFALLVYLAANVAYTFWLKRKVMIDIVLLAGLYTLRIIAGGAATGIMPSKWLLALSMFLFLSLALIKRFIELARLNQEGLLETDGRGYHVEDQEVLQMMGLSCGCMGVLVLALYINSNQVTQLYSRPEILWAVCPLLLYWIGRTWIWARRGAIQEDPLMFTLRDRTSWIVLACMAVLGFLAI